MVQLSICKCNFLLKIIQKNPFHLTQQLSHAYLVSSESIIISTFNNYTNNYLHLSLIFISPMISTVTESERLETIEQHFHLKGYDTMNNPSRN